MVRALAILGVVACAPPPAEFEITEVNPKTVEAGVGAAATVTGSNFYATVFVDLDDHSEPKIGRTWSVTIEGEPPQDVPSVSPDALAFVIPDTLGPDTYDVGVTSPDGESLMLANAFEVTRTLSWVTIDTLIVPVNFGAQVVSAVTLQSGVQYKLRASGTFIIQNDRIPQTEADAEWWNLTAPTDFAGGVDMGLGIDDATLDGVRTPTWGAYSPTHIYEVMWTGSGNPILANIHDEVYANDSGSLTLEILELR